MTDVDMRITNKDSVTWDKGPVTRERSLSPPPPPELHPQDSTFTAEPGELEIYCTDFGTWWSYFLSLLKPHVTNRAPCCYLIFAVFLFSCLLLIFSFASCTQFWGNLGGYAKETPGWASILVTALSRLLGITITIQLARFTNANYMCKL